MHKVTIIGNLGRDPELRYSPSGDAVCSMNVAENRNYTKADGEKVKVTIWFRVSIWKGAAEACKKYLTKGSKVYVEGTLEADKESGGPRTFKKQNGEVGASFEVRAERVDFLGGNEAQAEPKTEEEIPF
jgi:single-strand DNA-binding protein